MGTEDRGQVFKRRFLMKGKKVIMNKYEGLLVNIGLIKGTA